MRSLIHLTRFDTELIYQGWHRPERRFLKTHPTIFAVAGLVALFMAVAPSVGMAEEEGVTDDVEKNNVVSTNPILDMFTWWNLEYERKIASTGTVGLAGSFIDFEDDESFKSINAFYRFYPQERALSGFFFGARIGVYNVEDGNDSETAYGFGIDIAYSWLLGKRKGFSISLGIGRGPIVRRGSRHSYHAAHGTSREHRLRVLVCEQALLWHTHSCRPSRGAPY